MTNDHCPELIDTEQAGMPSNTQLREHHWSARHLQKLQLKRPQITQTAQIIKTNITLIVLTINTISVIVTDIFCAVVYYSGIIHILAVESHDVVEHALGLDSRTVWVKLYGLDVAVDGLVPLLLFAGLVAALVIFVCCHFR